MFLKIEHLDIYGIETSNKLPPVSDQCYTNYLLLNPPKCSTVND